MTQKLQDYIFGGAAVIVAKGVSLASGLIVVWLLNQILGKNLYGSYAAVMAMIQLLAVVGLAGLDQTILYRLSRHGSEPGMLAGGGLVRSVLMIIVPLGAIVVGVVIFVSTSEIWLSSNQEQINSNFLVGLAIAIPLINTQKVFAAWYQARHRVSEAVLVPVSINVSRALLLGLIFLVWPTQGGVVLGVVVSFAVPVLIWLQKIPFSNLSARERLSGGDFSYGFKLAVASLASHGMRNVNILMVGLLSTSSYTADYAVAIQLSAIMYAGNTVLRPVFTPRLGRYLADQDTAAIRLEFDQNRLLGLTAALGSAALFVGAGNEILSIFGNYQSAYSILLVISATAVFATGFGANGHYLNMAGYAGWSLLILITLLVCNVILNIILIPIYGALGAALASLVSVCSANILTTWLIWYLDRLPTINLGVVLSMSIAICSLLSAVFWNLDSLYACALVGLSLLVLVLSEKKLWQPVAARLADMRRR